MKACYLHGVCGAMEQKSALEGHGKKSRKRMIMKGEIFPRFDWEVFPFRTRFSLWYGMD
jgi:hypothetical protein